jgi:LysM repeat protein
MAPFLLLNILVSAAVVLGILYWWDKREQPVETANMVLVTVTPTAVPQAIATQPPAQAQATVQEAEAAPAVEESGPTIHVVKAGENLGSISQQYNVTIEEIMAASGLDNPNFLSVGQELVIPIGGLPTPTPIPTETPLPDEPPTPIPTLAAPTQGKAIVAISDVVGVGELTEEAVQIINSGDRQIGLLGWTLSDTSGFTYTFGQVTLFGEGAGILIHTEAGTDGPTDLYWGLELPILVSGKVLTLTDADGNVVSTYTVP